MFKELFKFQRNSDNHFGVILFESSRDYRELVRKRAVMKTNSFYDDVTTD